MNNEMKWIDVFDVPNIDEKNTTIGDPNILKPSDNKVENIDVSEIGDFYPKQEPETNKKPEKLNEKKIKSIFEEIKRKTEERNKPPGDYEISFNCRGKLLKDKNCSVCSSEIEAIYTVQYSEPIIYGPGGGGHWILSSCRCSKCKIVYNF